MNRSVKRFNKNFLLIFNIFVFKVQWLVSRSVLSISPQQLGELRVLRKTPQGSDLSQPLLSTRALQPLNDRVVRSSFIWH